MNLSSLVGWFSCEVEGSLFTGVPLPDNDTIYTVLLPEGVALSYRSFFRAITSACPSRV